MYVKVEGTESRQREERVRGHRGVRESESCTRLCLAEKEQLGVEIWPGRKETDKFTRALANHPRERGHGAR